MFDNLPLLFYCCLPTAIWRPLLIVDSNKKMQQNVQYIDNAEICYGTDVVKKAQNIYQGFFAQIFFDQFSCF